MYPIKKPYHWVSSTVPQPVEEGVKDMRISENEVGAEKTAQLSRTTVYDLVNYLVCWAMNITFNGGGIGSSTATGVVGYAKPGSC